MRLLAQYMHFVRFRKGKLVPATARPLAAPLPARRPGDDDAMQKSA